MDLKDISDEGEAIITFNLALLYFNQVYHVHNTVLSVWKWMGLI